MGKTLHFGLNKFGPEGRISDEGHKFSLRDRDLIDTLLFGLSTHSHQGIVASGIDGPAPNVMLDLEVNASDGTLPAGRLYFYRYSYVDNTGNETEASLVSSVSTPDLITPPGAPALTTLSTGGSLGSGTYRYALAFYQDAGGVTTAPNTFAITVPIGTSTNTITVDLPPLPDGADGWKIFRQAPGDLEYWLLDSVAVGPTEYVDDGSVEPDCTKRRPRTNTTNSTNAIQVTIPESELPLDTRVVSWNLYRSSNPGFFPANSRVASVVQTTTEGGTTLVTTFLDTGVALGPGIPLGQTSVPIPPPQLDAGKAFDLTGSRLPPQLAPLGVRTFNLLLPGSVVARDYLQMVPPHDMLVERIDAFFLEAPTGLDPGNDFVTIRFSDDHTQNEIQLLHNDAFISDEIQSVYTSATGGTFTLSDGVDTTDPIPFDATAETIETRLETDIASIIDVTVSGSGIQIDPWMITWVDPGATNVAQLVGDGAGLAGGTLTITTLVEGNDGGTFTLSDGVDTTDPIAFDADAATIETRLQADITSIVDVSVSGEGTFEEPWIIEFIDPGMIDLPLLLVSDDNLNGESTIEEAQHGHGVTEVDLVVDQNQQSHFWQSSATTHGSQEAEEAPAVGGDLVEDQLATNHTAAELDTQDEENHWNLGALDPGEYIAYFWVSDVNQTASFEIAVVDDHLGTPAVMESQSWTPSRRIYDPPYAVRFTVTGTEDIFFVTTKTDAGAGLVRIDKYEFEFQHPVLSGGSNVKVEAIIAGSPTTNGEDAQLVLWY